MKIPPFRLERFFNEHEFSAPVNLAASDCESMSVRELLAFEPQAESRLLDLSLSYTKPSGARELREAIAALYDTIDPEDVLVHAGGEEAIFTFWNAAVEIGDHAIVHQPSYASLAAVPAMLGCEVAPWTARASEGWRLDVGFLEHAIREDTRVVALNTPHNPTGYHMDRATWAELFRIAARHGVRVFSDEAYRGLEHRPGDRLPAACDVDERAVSLGLLSKGHGLPGLRIGWLASRDRQLLRRAAEIKDYTTICASGPSEILAGVALRSTEALWRRSLATVATNLARFRAFLDRYPGRFAWTPPAAGPMAYPSLIDGDDVEEFCRRVLQGCGVLLLPGTVFEPRSREFRVGLGRRDFPAGLRALESFLEAAP